MENVFYTYAYLREDGTPYYIGKGKSNRVFVKSKVTKPPKDKSRILILTKDLTEEAAFADEVYLISFFGRKDLGTGILHNRTNGGEGSSGCLPSEETKKKMSEASKGRTHTEETKKRMREAHKGVTHTVETKKKQSEAKKDRKWWNDGYGNTKWKKECPGDGWTRGRKPVQKLAQ